MGVQFRRFSPRRVVVGAGAGMVLLLLAGCSAEDRSQIENYALPGLDPRNATTTSSYIFDLWKWGWVAALVTGVLVWGLIFYASWRFRRRSDDEIPIQTRYNLPLEIFYTIAPVVAVIVFFFHTVQAQNAVLDEVDNPDNTFEIVGQRWQWTFNYGEQEAFPDQNVYEVGTASYIPTLYLPVGETTQFNLQSPDVIHSFWITGFLMKMDVVPGQVNHFQITPMQEGSFVGKCAELCGSYHSRMIFDVEVVSREEFDAYLQDQADAGLVSDEPLLGGVTSTTQAGRDEAPAGTEEGQE